MINHICVVGVKDVAGSLRNMVTNYIQTYSTTDPPTYLCIVYDMIFNVIGPMALHSYIYIYIFKSMYTLH